MENKVVKFKEVMGNYPTGVSVVTAFDEEAEPVGLTVNSFASVSLEPLLILWSIDNSVSSYDQFIKTDKFAINILAEDQNDLSMLFATKNADRFNQCSWKKSQLNLPVISNTVAVLQCETYQRVQAGDHMILIGEVMDLQDNNKKPLLYHNRKMGAIPELFYS